MGVYFYRDDKNAKQPHLRVCPVFVNIEWFWNSFPDKTNQWVSMFPPIGDHFGRVGVHFKLTFFMEV